MMVENSVVPWKWDHSMEQLRIQPVLGRAFTSVFRMGCSKFGRDTFHQLAALSLGPAENRMTLFICV
jgi:hypothetical protein